MKKVLRDTLCFLCIFEACMFYVQIFKMYFSRKPSWWKHKDKCDTFREIGSFSIPINANIRSRPSIIWNFSPNVNLMTILLREKNVYWFWWDLCGGYNKGLRTTSTFSGKATLYNPNCEEVARKYWGAATSILGSRFSPLSRYCNKSRSQLLATLQY